MIIFVSVKEKDYGYNGENSGQLYKFIVFVQPDEIKLRVIRKLSESLLRGKKKETSIQDSFGAWDDDKSAEEIIAEINKARVLGTRSIESFDE